MPKSLPAPLTFYPAYCFSLSPTHNTWARLTATDVHALRERPGFEGQGLYFHLNHPIKWIRLVGVIVAVEIYPTRCSLLLDDSSGMIIEVTCGRPVATKPSLPTEDTPAWSWTMAIPEAPMEGSTATGRSIDLRGVDIGTVAKVKGGIGKFRGEKQVCLERISIIRTTNEEVASWVENTAFRKQILNVPWIVSQPDEKRARRRAEGVDREQRARDERKKKRKIEHIAKEKPRSKAEKRVAVQPERKRNNEDMSTAAEDEKREQAKLKRAKERKLREQEFERLKTEEENDKPRLSEAMKEEKTPDKGGQEATTEAEKHSRKEIKRVAAEEEKQEQTRNKRDEERRLRLQEFERLKRLKENSDPEKDRSDAQHWSTVYKF